MASNEPFGSASSPSPRQSGAPRTSEGNDRARTAENDLLRRVPPHSPEAEQAVLGGILMRPQLMHVIVDLIADTDFYLPAHATIFRAFLDLYRKSAPIDLISTAEQLKSNNALEEAGGAVYLADLAQAVVSGANAEYYATIVRDKSLQRGLINACSSIISNCYDASREVGSLLDESEQAVFAISQRTTGRDFTGARELVDSVFENLSKLADSRDVITGVTTGYTRLDKLTAGLQPSDLIIVAARPSMGKTAFSLCMGLNAAIRQGVPVAVFSLEMSKEQLMQRMLAVWGKVDMSKLRRPALLTDADWSNLYAAADVISRAPIYIDDTPALTTLELRARARRLKAEKGLGLVIVDYLQLMRTSRRTDSRELEISDISRSLKGLAKEMNVPVVALSQLNRKVEERGDKRPMLSDLRESGAIEQDADVIMFVYRDDVYKFTKPADRPVQGIAEIIIGKQRNGPVGVAELLYMSPYTAFEDLAPDWAPPASLPMPAGLLLSPTARTVRSGPGRDPRGVAAAGRRFPCLAGRNDQRPVWGRSRGSCPLLRHAPSVVGAAAAALSAHTVRSYRPQNRLTPRPSPARWLGQRHGHRTPHPRQGPAMASLPCLGRHASFPAPLTGVSLPVSSCAPCRKRSSPCFSLPDLLRSGASVPLLPGQKIVRSTSIFPAIPAPLCKEK